MALCAVMPLKTTGPREVRSLAHAENLLATLNCFWSGGEPLSLTIVVPDAEVATVRHVLRPGAAVAVSVIGEGVLLPNQAGYPQISGWLKQMAVKLAFATIATTPFYIYFDADVLCCRPFDGETFLREGKAVSEYNHTATHPHFWINSAAMLHVSMETPRLVMGMTPNIFSREVSLACLERLGSLGRQSWDSYFAAHCSLEQPVSEEALYTVMAHVTGALDRLHWGAQTPRDWPRVHAPISLWDQTSQTLDAFDPVPWIRDNAKGHFVLVQSTLGYDPAAMLAKVAPLMEAHTPRWPAT